MPTDSARSATLNFSRSANLNRLFYALPPTCIALNRKTVFFYKTVTAPGVPEMPGMIAAMQSNLLTIMATLGWQWIDGSSGAKSNNYAYDMDTSTGYYISDIPSGVFLPDMNAAFYSGFAASGLLNMVPGDPMSSGYSGTYSGPSSFRAACYVSWTRAYITTAANVGGFDIGSFNQALPVGLDILLDAGSGVIAQAAINAGLWPYQINNNPFPKSEYQGTIIGNPCLTDVNGTPSGIFFAPPVPQNAGLIRRTYKNYDNNFNVITSYDWIFYEAFGVGNLRWPGDGGITTGTGGADGGGSGGNGGAGGSGGDF